jgi:rRNA-processing protein FCF1
LEADRLGGPEVRDLRKVIFDSSFLMSVAKKPTTWKDDMIDLIGGFEPIILDCVRSELEGLAERGGKKGSLASVGLQIARDFGSRKSGHAPVDDEITSAALTDNAVVATSDRDLQDSLTSVGVQVVRLRKGRVALG